MTPTELVRSWIEKVNAADLEGLAELYAQDAIDDTLIADAVGCD